MGEKGWKEESWGERDHFGSLVVSLYELQNKIAKWGERRLRVEKLVVVVVGVVGGGEKLVWEAAGEEPGEQGRRKQMN